MFFHFFQGNYISQVSCPVSDSRFVTCVLQGEGLVDADGEPVMDKMVDYAKALGLPWGRRLQNADMEWIFISRVCRIIPINATK